MGNFNKSIHLYLACGGDDVPLLQPNIVFKGCLRRHFVHISWPHTPFKFRSFPVFTRFKILQPWANTFPLLSNLVHILGLILRPPTWGDGSWCYLAIWNRGLSQPILCLYSFILLYPLMLPEVNVISIHQLCDFWMFVSIFFLWSQCSTFWWSWDIVFSMYGSAI